MSEDSQRFRLTVGYDGRSFEGWQSQPGGNTIQDCLLETIQRICPGVSTLQGAGRTDSGVSAEGQVAHFDVPADWRMDGEAWVKALNAHLPPTVRIFACEAVASDFHARFSALGKVYRYRIFVGPVLPPLEYGLAWHRRELDVEGYLGALQWFVGTHYFRAFSANRGDGHDETRDTGRTLYSIVEVPSGPDRVVVDIHGNGFLYKMIRFLVGTAFYVSAGKLSEEQVVTWLAEEAPGEKAPYCAPPDGLSLQEVRYE